MRTKREGRCTVWPLDCSGGVSLFLHAFASDELFKFAGRATGFEETVLGCQQCMTFTWYQNLQNLNRVKGVKRVFPVNVEDHQALTLTLIIFYFIEFAFRRCSTEGQWEQSPTATTTTTTNTVGWTNYTLCFSPEMAELMHKLNNNEGQVRMQILG